DEIVKRRPDDWDGSKLKDVKGGVYEAPTLISGDGVHPSNPKKYRDFSDESLRSNGYALRSYLTLMKYAEVMRRALHAEAPKSETRTTDGTDNTDFGCCSSLSFSYPCSSV